MSENARDTQFAGFARLQAEEAGKMPQYAHEPIEEMNRRFQLLLARRAYDLAQHAVGHTLEYLHECGLQLPSHMDMSILPSIPDLNDWSKWGYKEQEDKTLEKITREARQIMGEKPSRQIISEMLSHYDVENLESPVLFTDEQLEVIRFIVRKEIEAHEKRLSALRWMKAESNERQ